MFGRTTASRGTYVLAPLTRLPVPVESIVGTVAEAFRARVEVRPDLMDLRFAHDVSRGQYHSSRILLALLDRFPRDADRLIGIADVDLFVPVLTYLFGEAQLGGRVAVASSFRLRESYDGRSGQEALLRARLSKTVLHELGHTRGLRHCRDNSCVMAAANNVELLDEKQEGFCLDCRGELA